MKLWQSLGKVKASIAYMFLVLTINIAYAHLPMVKIHHQALSSADWIAGSVYLFRDFAQREIKHSVIIVMLVAAFFSYLLAAPVIALASVSAFVAGELLDWSIFTFAQRSLVFRLLFSSMISVPVDSLIFLLVLHQLNFVGFMVMNFSKWCGIALVFAYWSYQQYRNQAWQAAI